MKLAIIVGVSSYQNCSSLEACRNDVSVMGSVLNQLNKFDDICEISGSPKAYEAKQRITEFVNKHKSEEVEELVFYYTGHGARYEDDFFYVFSDFSENKKEVTGLRNTELDGLIRNLSPNLTLKIIDACYAGNNYVKSESDIKPILEKSAKENELNKLYFLHSSSSEEQSLATNEFSLFTKSFFESLTQNEGAIRVRDIMAYVADDMHAGGHPKPTFVVQADNTEIFGDITSGLIDYIKDSLSLDTNSIESNSEGSSDKPVLSLIDIIKQKSDNEYCDKDEGFNNIEIIRRMFEQENWHEEIIEIFDFEYKEVEYSIPNENAIARWLIDNKSEGYFLEPDYKTKTYHAQEYVEVPKKPVTGLHRALLSGFAGFEDDVDYKLEKVEKSEQVLSGISFTTSTPFKAYQVFLTPKYKSVETYVTTVVPVFSRNSLVVFYCSEVLNYIGWDSVSRPLCNKWKIHKLALKDSTAIENFCASQIDFIRDFVMKDVESKIGGH